MDNLEKCFAYQVKKKNSFKTLVAVVSLSTFNISNLLHVRFHHYVLVQFFVNSLRGCANCAF